MLEGNLVIKEKHKLVDLEVMNCSYVSRDKTVTLRHVPLTKSDDWKLGLEREMTGSDESQ